MSLQKVRWTVLPTRAPRPILNCHSCKTKRHFESSGKFRLNASGKRLDAWLVYNCIHCGSSWNRTVFERKHVNDVASDLLEKLQANDPALAQQIAHDVPALRLHAMQLDFGETFEVEKQPCLDQKKTLELEIEMRVPHGQGPRLDRLLAEELGLSRTCVVEMAKSGAMRIVSAAREPLRRPVMDGTRIVMR